MKYHSTLLITLIQIGLPNTFGGPHIYNFFIFLLDSKKAATGHNNRSCEPHQLQLDYMFPIPVLNIFP